MSDRALGKSSAIQHHKETQHDVQAGVKPRGQQVRTSWSPVCEDKPLPPLPNAAYSLLFSIERVLQHENSGSGGQCGSSRANLKSQFRSDFSGSAIKSRKT
jgi:hypothetical protein